jgi:hypothetical protein
LQNYAAKYVGISRGIPLSNTNQLWGLLLGLLVFRELRGLTTGLYAEVIGGSVMMALGALAISLCSASEGEYVNCRRAAQHEAELYGIDPAYVLARMEGREMHSAEVRRTWKDWSLIGVALAIFAWLGTMASVPEMEIEAGWLILFGAMLIAVFVAGALVLWRVTRFS